MIINAELKASLYFYDSEAIFHFFRISLLQNCGSFSRLIRDDACVIVQGDTSSFIPTANHLQAHDYDTTLP